MAVFCAAAVVFLVARDLLISEVRDVEVWFGFELRGVLAIATAPLHWALFALGAVAFWREDRRAFPLAAGYAFYIALSHLVWNLTSDAGQGLAAGLTQLVLFSLPGFALLALRPRLPVPTKD